MIFMTPMNSEVVTPIKGESISVETMAGKIQSWSKCPTKDAALYTVIKTGGGSHGLYSHAGEEFGYVLQGELELILNDKVHQVRKDESFYFSSLIPHNWGNKGKEDVIILWVITPPSF
jgi:quercetin dioxygenase-like cupin family protein